MLYISPFRELVICKDSEFVIFGDSINSKKIDLSTDENIKLWEDRISKIEKGETVMNNNVHKKEPYFGAGMDKERQINFCKRQIEKLTLKK